MPTLHYSNHLEQLVQPLGQNLQSQDPFRPSVLVVPNFNLQKWLSLELAKFQGIAAHLEFRRLEQAIAQAMLQPSSLEISSPEVLPKAWLHTDHLHRLIIQLLHDYVLQKDDADWRYLKDYICRQGTLSAGAQEVRVFQLAGRIAQLFQEYGYHRPQLLKAWESGDFGFSNTHVLETERWQRKLWRALFGPIGSITSHNEQVLDLAPDDSQRWQWYTLPQLVERYPSRDQQSQTDRETLHIFGISYISSFHREALSKLDQTYRIHVYTLTPCMEFWEDLETEWETKKRLSKASAAPLFSDRNARISTKEFESGTLIENEESNSFLQAWGRPGRENMRLLNELSSWNYEAWFADPMPFSPPTLLQQIQYDILVREPQRRSPLGIKPDDSLRVLACPSTKRESEIVANEIWTLVQNAPHLKFNDIAVIVPDMQLYQADLELSFQRLHRIPYNLIDGAIESGGQLVDGALKLFQLGLGEYTRKDLFAILSHPNFMQRFASWEIDPEQWLQWVDEAGILYGVDTTHHRQSGYDYFQRDLYHWEQGLRRLTLGLYLQQERDWDPQIYELEGQKYFPVSVEHALQESAVQFIILVRSLIADTREMPKWRLSAHQWGRYFVTLMHTYLAPINSSEEGMFRKFVSELYNLQEMDAVFLKSEGKPASKSESNSELERSQTSQEHEAAKSGKMSEKLSYRMILEFVKHQQQKVTVQRGYYLADGVTISSFLPMRPIPFQAVFILGLGEGLFPAPFKKNNLDLREARIPLRNQQRGFEFRERQIGDVSDTEKDKYMFLETLISTRRYLYLSYVDRDDQTNDPLAPSSVLQTLLTVLNEQYLPVGTQFPITVFPLKNYSLAYFPEIESSSILPNFDPRAYQQARAIQLRKHLDSFLKAQQAGSNPPRDILLGQFDKWNITQKPLVKLTEEPLEEPLRSNVEIEILESESDPLERASTVIPIHFHQLRAFLECPLQATAKRKLRIMEDEASEDLREVVQEPFETPFLQENLLLKSVLTQALEQQIELPNWESLYEQQAELFELRGDIPTGAFKRWSRSRHLQQLAAWHANLKNAIPVSWKTLAFRSKIYRFGKPREGEPVQEIFPPIRLDISLHSGETVTIELQGSTHWSLVTPDEDWHSLYLSNVIKPLNAKHHLRAFLDMIVLTIAGQAPQTEWFQSNLIPAVEAKPQIQAFRLLSAEKAQTYLTELIRAMLEDPYTFLMPIEAVIDLCKSHLPNEVDSEEFNRLLKQKVRDLIENGTTPCSSTRGPLQHLEAYAPPKDGYSLYRQRFLPFFEAMITTR